ncbi:MAG: phosphoribosylglycinamide formyltransferase [Bacteroidetes bacterium]|nr:phosphoribosylglycinamide formyltransferase [Bacteroidota bacterium]|tara:strand:- start:123 stop:689 length:567 start_codon:yes stop_codon:yes gene_type:complete
MKKIAILASGNGSNAENIAHYLNDFPEIEISIILSNKRNAYVHTRAENLKIPSMSFNRQMFYESEEVLDVLKENDVDCIVLAGFLWLIPESLIKAYPDKIINIHPALLPKYGGKGMYGSFVHEAVHAAKEIETGITIHLVNEKYDDGKILFQAKTPLNENDTPDSIAEKVHALEYEHFPRIVVEYLSN